MLVCGPLLNKQPSLFANHFVEALFVLNRCTAHPIYKAAASMGDGGSGISVGFEGINLKGEVGRARRQEAYGLMLSNMSDEKKTEVTFRIAKDVLGSALESGSDLNRVCTSSFESGTLNPDLESARMVLSDAFAVLSSKHIRVGRSGGSSSREEEEIQDPNQPDQTRLVAKCHTKKVLSKISRAHMIETMLPILVQLKDALQKSCSPLLKDLMSYLVEVHRQYKTEMKDFLATNNNSNLFQEIEYDSAKVEKAARKEKRRNSSLSAANSSMSAVISVGA
jgi:condensin-2 complex subunit D3